MKEVKKREEEEERGGGEKESADVVLISVGMDAPEAAPTEGFGGEHLLHILLRHKLP